MYKHLTLSDRCVIEAMLKQKITQVLISESLKVHKSTISREIRRNSILKKWATKKVYLGQEAHHKAQKSRRLSKYQCKKIDDNVKLSNYIKSEIKRKDVNLSPKIIANSWNTLHKDKKDHITHESIYKWLDTAMWNEYKKYLLYKKGYKKVKTKKWSKIKDRIMIEERDKNLSIKNRLEKWHYEADLIVSCKWYKWAILTLIDRYSRLSHAFKIEDKSSENIMKLIASVIDELWIKTVTFDNWMEFAKHKLLQKLWVSTYFCHSYASWQKWSIENLNRIFRRTYPKWTNFDEINQKQVKSAIDIINNTPREILGYISPNKAHS